MKIRNVILFIWGFLAAGAVFAQNKAYINVYEIHDYNGNRLNNTVWFVQEQKKCENSARDISTVFFTETYYDCVEKKFSDVGALWNGDIVDVSKTAEIINSFFKNHDDYKKIAFNSAQNPFPYNSEFEAIDFGELKITTGFFGSQDTSCVVNHTPIHLGSKIEEFDGQWKVFKNLCFTHDVSSKNTVNSIGFLDDIDGVFVHSTYFHDVFFSVKKSSGSAVKNGYPPTGVLAGVVKNGTIDDVTLTDVSVSAPIAGGIAGVIVNSTMINVSGDDDVFVQNTIDMSNEGVASFPWFNDSLNSLGITYNGKYNVYLGGIAGVSYDVTMKNVSLIAKVSEQASSKESSLGGFVGGYVLSQDATGAFPEIVLDSVSLPRKTSLDNNNVYTKVSGGKSMGGIIGDLSVYGGVMTGTRTLAIKNSSFKGRVFNMEMPENFVGGFIGRAVDLNRGSLKIENSQSELTFKDTLKTDNSVQYHVGGFIGDAMLALSGNGTESKNDLFVSIKNSKSTGSIVLEKDPASTPSVKAFVGGLVGDGAFTFDSTAMVEDTSSMHMTVDVGLSTDSLMIGGFVGKLASYNPKSEKKDILIDQSVFDGSVVVKEQEGHAFIGGIIGHNESTGSSRTIISNTSVANDSVFIKVGKADSSMTGYKHVGGLCGYCGALTNVENVSVAGDIEVLGSSKAFADVGGLGGTILTQTSQNFEVSKAFFKGDVKVSSNISSANAGYMVGLMKFQNPGKSPTVYRKFVSTYHMGQDTLDAFGLISGVGEAGGMDWKTLTSACNESTSSKKGSAYCWDVRYNVRNGSSENLTSTNNGTFTKSYMKSASFADFLNEPFTDTAWAWKMGVNDNTPYLLMKKGAMKPLPPGSSSSEVGSSSEEPEISSSSEFVPETSSSAEESSSSAVVPETSSAEECSSSAVVPETSSSETSSSSKEPETSSSSEFVPQTSSSVEPESSSSSEIEVAKFVKPEILSKLVEPSSAFTKFTFGIKVDSMAGKVSASLRVSKEGETLYEDVVVDSISESMEKVLVSLVSLPAGELSYEFTLSCDSAQVTAAGKFVAVESNVSKEPVKTWQMVSIADLDFESLVLDERNLLYWWDETEKFGDYWQYHVYTPNDNGPESRGYWFGTFDGTKLNRKVSAYADDKEIVWNLDSVHSGWNLVSNPYGWNVDVSELAESAEIWNWNAEKGKYEQRYELRPYEAVWVKASGAKVLRFAATSKSNGAVSLAKRTSLARAADDWTIRATLSDEFGKDDSWNLFGVNSTTFESEEPPEGMGDYVSFSFMEEKRALAKSFKPASSEMEWSARLKATSERDAFLKLEGVDEAVATGNKVFVTIDGKTTEMTDGKSLRVKVGRTAKFATIRVAPAPRAKVEYALQGVRAVYTGNALNVQFSVTEGLAGTWTEVDLVGLDGRLAASASAKASVGSNMITMPAPDHGLYVLRVRAGSQVSTKNILLK